MGIPTGFFCVEMGWVWELKFNSHGSPALPRWSAGREAPSSPPGLQMAGIPGALTIQDRTGSMPMRESGCYRRSYDITVCESVRMSDKLQ